jgi:hypothetical protein
MFFSPRMAELLRNFSVAGVTWHPMTANRAHPGAKRDLVFGEFEESDIVDWANSVFVRRRRGEPDEPRSFDNLESYQEAVAAGQERRDGTVIEPGLIRLIAYKDLFRFPLRDTLIASRQIVKLVQAHNLTGACLRPLSFEIN